MLQRLNPFIIYKCLKSHLHQSSYNLPIMIMVLHCLVKMHPIRDLLYHIQNKNPNKAEFSNKSQKQKSMIIKNSLVIKNIMVIKIIRVCMSKPMQIYKVQILVSQNNLINPVKVIQGQPKNMNQFMIRLYLYTITLSKVLRIYFSIKIYLIFFR